MSQSVYRNLSNAAQAAMDTGNTEELVHLLGSVDLAYVQNDISAAEYIELKNDIEGAL